MRLFRKWLLEALKRKEHEAGFRAYQAMSRLDYKAARAHLIMAGQYGAKIRNLETA